MRALSKEELELIAGGWSTDDPMDTIHVYADAYDSSWGMFDVGNDPWDYNYYDGNGSGDGGGPPPLCTSSSAADIQTYTDQLASTLAHAIKFKPDDESREYIGAIYRNADGTLQSSSLHSANLGNGGRVRWDFRQEGIDPANVTGIVHNHDLQHYGQNTYSQSINRFPSDQDWNSATLLVNSGADPNLLSLYVIDTLGVLREFRYINKSTYEHHQSSAPVPVQMSTSMTPAYCPN